MTPSIPKSPSAGSHPLTSTHDETQAHMMHLLADAISRGDAHAVSHLLKQGADPTGQTKEGLSMASHAITHCQSECLVLLLQAELPLKDPAVTTLLLKQAIEHDDHCLQALIDAGAPLEGEDEKKNTPLLHACARGSNDSIDMLIHAGCDLFKHNSQGETCPFLLRNRRTPIALSHWLRATRQHPDFNEHRRQRLQSDMGLMVSLKKNVAFLRAYVEAGCDIHYTLGGVHQGFFMLSTAVSAGDLDTIDYLKSLGVRVSTLSEQEELTQSVKVNFNFKKFPEKLLTLLDSMGMDLNFKDNDGRPLWTFIQTQVDKGIHEPRLLKDCLLFIDAKLSQKKLLSELPPSNSHPPSKRRTLSI